MFLNYVFSLFYQKALRIFNITSLNLKLKYLLILLIYFYLPVIENVFLNLNILKKIVIVDIIRTKSLTHKYDQILLK